jgi:LDH2 family malate/lactate/ureidoglycolate dehydrogenase
MAALVKSEILQEFVTKVFLQLSIPQEDATWTAETLVRAELRGVTSHGVIRLPAYVRRLEAGMLNPRPKVRVLKEAGPMALLDGDNGMGQVTSKRGMEDCIARAETHNIGLVFLKGSNHFGMASTYACLASDRGMIGFCTTNTPRFMVPSGGQKPMVGNNPIAIAIPGDPPIVLDMALSAVARGYILQAARAGKPIPEGWGVDAEGRPTTDPNAVLEGGSLAPIAGYKGSGLSIAIDAVLGTISGEGHSHEIRGMMDLSGLSRVPHLFAAIRIEALMPPEKFRMAINAFTALLRATPRASGVERVWMPGEIEKERESESRRKGIALSEERWVELARLADHFSLPPLEAI